MEITKEEWTHGKPIRKKIWLNLYRKLTQQIGEMEIREEDRKWNEDKWKH